MSLFRYIRSSKVIYSYASYILDVFINEIHESESCISCKDDVMAKVKQRVKYYKDDFSHTAYSDKELQECAVCFISLGSFELLEGNKYRVMGHINWIGPAKCASLVHKKAIQWSVDRNLTTKEEAEEDALALRDAIHQRL